MSFPTPLFFCYHLPLRWVCTVRACLKIKLVSCVYSSQSTSRLGNHLRVHIGVEQKLGECICPLSCSVHHNFVNDGRYTERGWKYILPPHQHGIIFPTWWNVLQKVAGATLCTLWQSPSSTVRRIQLTTILIVVFFQQENRNFRHAFWADERRCAKSCPRSTAQRCLSSVLQSSCAGNELNK